MPEPRKRVKSRHEKDLTDSKCTPALENASCRHLVSIVCVFPWLPTPIHPIMTRLIAGYQPFMLLALKRWFPDFESQVLAVGGMIKSWTVGQYLSGLVTGDPAYIQPEARCLPKHPNIPRDGKVPQTFYLSRVLLEPLLRSLVKQRYSSVRFLRGTVTGIVLGADKRRVTGVEYADENGGRVNLGCALFVDCTGMARMGVKWLQKLIYRRRRLPRIIRT
jgi:hypothetical protein